MPDRDLPEELKARLSAELTSGAPLNAPLPSQARYATASPAARRQGHLRGRMLALAAAGIVVLLAAGFAGPPQQRAWLVRTVGNLAGDLGAPVSTASPSAGNPTPDTSPRGGTDDRSPSPEKSPDGDETPGAQESPEPSESPKPSQTPESHESPEPTQSPDGGSTSGGDGDHSSPSPSPSPDGGGSDDGH